MSKRLLSRNTKQIMCTGTRASYINCIYHAQEGLDTGGGRHEWTGPHALPVELERVWRVVAIARCVSLLAHSWPWITIFADSRDVKER